MAKKAQTTNIGFTQEQVQMMKGLLGVSQMKMVTEMAAGVKEQDERKVKFYTEKMQEAETLEKLLDKADARTNDTSEDAAEEEDQEEAE